MSFPFQINPSTDDEKFMYEALKEAWKAYGKKEVPIGAVLVKDGKIIARGHNQVEMLNDATAHAEMLCITAGENALSNSRLLDSTLYSTVEPCAMCAGAMFLTRIKRLVWGTTDNRHGAHGSWMNLFEKKHPIHYIETTQGILAEPSALLLKQFFQEQRRKPDEVE